MVTAVQYRNCSFPKYFYEDVHDRKKETFGKSSELDYTSNNKSQGMLRLGALSSVMIFIPFLVPQFRGP